MATRADFYLGRGRKSVWIGSIADDGHPADIVLTDPLRPANHILWPPDAHLFDSVTEAEFRDRVQQFFAHRHDVAVSKWPWRYADSHLTDYTYAFDEGKVWASYFGRTWFDPHHEPRGAHGPKEAIFPVMIPQEDPTLRRARLNAEYGTQLTRKG